MGVKGLFEEIEWILGLFESMGWAFSDATA